MCFWNREAGKENRSLCTVGEDRGGGGTGGKALSHTLIKKMPSKKKAKHLDKNEPTFNLSVKAY